MDGFHYLGKQGFPHAQGVDVYKYDNDFDYSRYDFDQMRLTLCSVPWDLGEAHIGNRSIDGIGNVVYFGSAAKRDKWFSSLPETEKYVWDTKYRALHTTLQVTVPVPYDVAAKYNYLYVQYHAMAHDGSPVEYEDAGGIRTWCYFVRDVTFQAPNASTLTLMVDTWQTFIYGFDVTGMILERGHAPMLKTSTADYLKDPINKSRYLLAPDVSFGELQKVTHTAGVSLNDKDVLACFCTTGDCDGNWGVKGAGSWSTPSPSTYNLAGVPSMQLLTMQAVSINTFLKTVRKAMPQFLQTVQAVYFIEAAYLSLGAGFTFGGVTCRLAEGGASQDKDILTLTQSLFGYERRYQGVAKLYTWPYAALEISDDQGNVTLVHIEETTGTIRANVAANVVFPFLNLQAVIKGIGGTSHKALSFHNVGAHSFDFPGRWHKCLMRWDIPTFAVLSQASVEYDYRTDFDRKQMDNDRACALGIAQRDAANALANANTQAASQQAIANDTAATNKANAERDAQANWDCAVAQANNEYSAETNNAQNTLDNATATTTANTSITMQSASTATQDASYTNDVATSNANWANYAVNNTVNSERDAKVQSAAVSAVSGVVNSVSSGAISGAMTAGGRGALVGAAAGLVSGALDAAATAANTMIALNLSTTQANTSVTVNEENAYTATRTTSNRTANANIGRNNITVATNTMTSTIAANNAATINTNASNAQITAGNVADKVRETAIADAGATYTTATGNASTAYSAATSIASGNNACALADAQDTYANEGERIDNLVRQAGLAGPSVFGRIDNAATSTTRPQAIVANVVTQPDYAIAAAGDEMLRYGYTLGQYWDFDGNWAPCKHFTYWKLRDYWVSNNAMQDVYQDALRFFLMGGVTVWGKPEDIGKVGIYDNGF